MERNVGNTRAVCQPAPEPDSELQRDEDDGEEALLCDSEEMDLLGEIFDTLSSRSSHDRGLLYGTRSLDLFGPDSHDYITKRGPANPSQESLSLSISGSGSLHSWNLETTEELSDLTEDSDWLCLDTSVQEEEGSENLSMGCETVEQQSGQREDAEKEEEVKVVINGNQIGRNNFEEVKHEEEREKEDEEKRVSLRGQPVGETSVKPEDEELKEKKEEERNQKEEAAEGQETDKIQRSAAQEGEGKENQEEEDKESKGYLNKLVKLKLHDPEAVEEQQQGQKDTATPEAAVSPGLQSVTAAEPKLPAGQEKRNEEAGKHEECEIRQTFTPPKVLSALARFQSQPTSQSFQAKTRTTVLAEPGRSSNVLRTKENTQAHPTSDSVISENSHSEAQEEDRPLIKVSELKKRFEA